MGKEAEKSCRMYCCGPGQRATDAWMRAVALEVLKTGSICDRSVISPNQVHCLLYLIPVVSDHCGSSESRWIAVKERTDPRHMDEYNLIYITGFHQADFVFLNLASCNTYLFDFL